MSASFQDILSQGSVPGSTFPISINSIIIAVAALAFSLVTYALVRRNGFSGGVVETLSQPREDQDELSRSFLLNEKLSRDVERMKGENKELLVRLKHLEDLERIETALRKSNVSLGKECERLKSENEELTLKLNALSIKTKPKIKKLARKQKTKK